MLLLKHCLRIDVSSCFETFLISCDLIRLFSDYVVGFGGKFGIQKDRQDKSALGYDSVDENAKHGSQIDQKKVILSFQPARK